MRSVSVSSFLIFAAVLGLGMAWAADDDADRLPAGDGKPVFVKVCGGCHGYDDIRKNRMSRDEWNDKISEMIVNGAKGTDEEMETILGYLTQNFGPDSKIWVNTAPFGELKSVFQLTNEETDALIAYRTKNGPFKQFEDVAKAPGVDAQKLEAAKEKMAF